MSTNMHNGARGPDGQQISSLEDAPISEEEWLLYQQCCQWSPSSSQNVDPAHAEEPSPSKALQSIPTESNGLPASLQGRLTPEIFQQGYQLLWTPPPPPPLSREDAAPDGLKNEEEHAASLMCLQPWTPDKVQGDEDDDELLSQCLMPWSPTVTEPIPGKLAYNIKIN